LFDDTELVSKKAIRGQIILLAADGKNNREIVKELNVSVDMARLWRQRWLDLHSISMDDLSVEERLEDLPRPGRPPRLTANQICQIEELACEKPESSGRPITQWTGREIADEIMKARHRRQDISSTCVSAAQKKASDRT